MSYAIPGAYGPGTYGLGGYNYANVPGAASWTLVNPAANTAITDLPTSPQGGVRFTTPAQLGGTNFRLAVQAATTSVLCAVDWWGNANFSAILGLGFQGVVLRNSTSGRMCLAGLVPGGDTRLRLDLVTFSNFTTFNSTPTRINPYTLAIGTQATNADVAAFPRWFGLKVAGTNVECWAGWDFGPTNLFRLYTASGAATYIQGGGGSVDQGGLIMDTNNIGNAVYYGMDVHSAYFDGLL